MPSAFTLPSVPAMNYVPASGNVVPAVQHRVPAKESGDLRCALRSASRSARSTTSTVSDVPDPVPGPGEALVRVAAASVNFPDSLLIAGRYQVRAEPPFIPGSEYAGEIVALGRPWPGDRQAARVCCRSVTWCAAR